MSQVWLMEEVKGNEPANPGGHAVWLQPFRASGLRPWRQVRRADFHRKTKHAVVKIGSISGKFPRAEASLETEKPRENRLLVSELHLSVSTTFLLFDAAIPGRIALRLARFLRRPCCFKRVNRRPASEEAAPS